MKENKKELNFDNVKNEYFKYLKYPDNSGMTILFSPGSDSVCNSIRIICDRHSRLLNIKEFDTLYRKRKHMDRFAWWKKLRGYTRDEEWSGIFSIQPEK